MSIEDFFLNVQLSGHDEYFKALIMAYVNQRDIMPTDNGRNLYQLFNYDSHMISEVGSDIRPFLNFLLTRYKEKKQDQPLADALNSQAGFLTISSSIFGSVHEEDLVHKLFLAIKDQDIYPTLEMLIGDLNAQGIGYRVMTKAVNCQNKGQKDAIIVMVSSDNLEKVLNIFTEKYQALLQKPNPMMSSIKNIGYASLDPETNRDMRELLGEILIACIDDAITEYRRHNPDAFKDLDNADADIRRVKIIQSLIPTTDIMSDILKRIPEKGLIHGLDINNMFMSKQALSELNQLYNLVDKTEPVAKDVTKYAFLNEPDSFFEQTITMLDGQVLTIYDYLEQNDVLHKIPENACVTILGDSSMSGADFIKYALKYAHRYANFDAIMEIFIRNMTRQNHKK